MKRWTAEDLERLLACAKQVELFRATFPVGATADDVPRAMKAGLDVEWLVATVVSDEARAEYERQHAPLWAEYERQCAPLLAAALRTVEEVVA